MDAAPAATTQNPPPPYPMSWIDHVLRWVQRLPLPSGLYYAAFAVAAHAAATAARVHDGKAVGEALRMGPPPPCG